jgi:protein-S-isoprenylcysteine O-methyltransferase Ste14
VQRSDLVAGGFTFFTVALWAGFLPAALLRDEAGIFRLSWRPVPFIALAALCLLAGSALLLCAGRQLARANVPLLGVRPGAALVTDGCYRRVRNPQHIGTALVTLAPAVALDRRAMWVIPVVATVWLVVGLEPLEERRLLEVFGDEFREYRSAVPKWFPRMKG